MTSSVWNTMTESQVQGMIDNAKVCEILNRIVEAEMAGVVRYAHSSLMVSGPNRIPIVQFLQEQANESLAHASTGW